MVTTFFRDMSDFNTDETIPAGWVGTTHKVTEGTRVKHNLYGPRLNRYRAAGYPILGAYHVVRTPGNNGHGSLQAQVNYWFDAIQAATPWWRSHPWFLLQIDGEIWEYDAVSASTIKAFAALVKAQAPDNCLPITYASRGQYGDQLAGIVTPLWNANYGSNTGVYPGDTSTRWNPYSGDRPPTFLQYCSRPFDSNAFRGSLAQLKALFPKGGTDMELDDTLTTMDGETKRVRDVLGDVHSVNMNGHGPYASRMEAKVNQILAAVGRPVSITLDQATVTQIAGAAAAAAVNHHDALSQEDLTAMAAAIEARLKATPITVQLGGGK